jgi:pyruvate/2-oxoglutarate dehydrogenase complex dihydrolipoamide dehydrogenase (E3) component
VLNPEEYDVVGLADGGTRLLHGRIVVINTGSRARVEPTPGLRESRPLTHVEALELDQVPDHRLVLGGGYVGLEMAQAFRRLGSRVTIVERNHAVAHREDQDVSEALEQLLSDEGIDVCTNATVVKVDGQSGASVRLHATRDGIRF